jgi:hypothetical protein
MKEIQKEVPTVKRNLIIALVIWLAATAPVIAAD